MRRLRLSAVILGAALVAEAADPRWRMRYFHDDDEWALTLVDLKFPSAARGVAVGVLSDSRGQRRDTRPTAVVTSDGGATWSLVRLEENPVSLFFLDDSLGWLVTTRGVWQTEEAGRRWKKLKGIRGLLRVHFLDAKHGFAVGLAKSMYETRDGGKQWSRVPAAAEPKSSPRFTAYGTIAFAGPVGLVAGWMIPPRRDQNLPDWIDPEQASERAEWPALAITLETRDGGASWKSQISSMFGRITRLVLQPEERRALSLIEFNNSFEWPSEVHEISFRDGSSTRVFREKNRAVKDVAVAGGFIWLAAVEPPGALRQLPIPGKLKMLRSVDRRFWRETEVDYRAVAGRAHLAAPDAGNLWVATDTGMILKWE